MNWIINETLEDHIYLGMYCENKCLISVHIFTSHFFLPARSSLNLLTILFSSFFVKVSFIGDILFSWTFSLITCKIYLLIYTIIYNIIKLFLLTELYADCLMYSSSSSVSVLLSSFK